MVKKPSKFVASAAYSRRLQSWEHDDAPAPRGGDVLSLLASFLKQIGYKQTSSALVQEAKANEIVLDLSAFEKSGEDSLFDILAVYHTRTKSWPSLVTNDSEEADSSSASDDSDADMIDDEAEETSDDSSDEESVKESAKKDGGDKKRKRAATPESSDASDVSSDSSSASSSDSDSSEDDAPPAKKTRRESVSSAASSSSSSSEGSSSSSDSDSSSSESDSSSSSSDSSSSEEESPSVVSKSKKKNKPVKKVKARKNADTETSESGSSTSATLSAQSPPPKKKSKKVQAAEVEAEIPAVAVIESGMHPDRFARIPAGSAIVSPGGNNMNKLKKSNVPFSRIPADTKVDPRFASNAYVSYDYADRAHQDLIVTKGKGFTKEKNKKKRGSYRGGAIDLTPKGIKFDD